ncbi:hypothetical protein PspLS_00320 [Pyricularia sp. CBS 133598]|nr:hypothetical protein PspLS_00320 [Pyricularia sp. CBS 133598]
MSSSQPTTEVQTFATLDLDAESHLMHADAVDLNGFQLDGTPNGSLHDDAPPQNGMDSSHFGDFQFPFQTINDESTIVAMTDASPAVDIFPPPQHRPSISSIPADRRGSIASATGPPPSYNGNRASQRRPSQVTSEDGSPDSNGNGLLLEDPGADEFGLISSGPGDASGAGKFKDDKGESMPAWSELKTKAGKERKRLPLACIACRRKKIRCSGEKPACKHCLRSRIPCVYKVTARKAAPRTDYMAMLDKRLKRMEERIIKTVSKSEQDGIAATVMRSVLKPAIPGTLNASKAAAKKRGAEEAFGPELDNWARSSTKSKTDASGRPATLLLHEAEENKLLQEGADALPSREIQEHLAEVFFDDIYGQAYHLLHRPSYMRKLRAGTLPPAIRMAFALQLHKDLEYDPHSGRAQLSFVDREIRRRTMWACFLMDRFNSSGTERPTFIKEETVKIPLPVKEKYFQLDIPGATEDLNGLTLNAMDMDEDQASQSKENMGVAAYMVRSIAVWGRIINYLNQGGKELDPHPMWSPDAEYAKLIKQSEDLPASLPESLQYNRENLKLHDTEGMANQFLFLHISLQQNILFMNRFAVSSPGSITQQDVPKSFVTKAGAKAFAAANRMSELLKDAEPYLVSAPFVGYCTFLSSTVHIFGIFSGNPTIESTSKRNLATNVRFLSKMKRFWGMFHFMTENLREQYRACADAARQGNPANENSPQIFQYGDWFDRYPHGVSQSDFLDPVKYMAKEKGNDAVLEQKPELATVEEFMTKMSPRSAEGAVNNGQGAKPQPAKRKSIAKRGGSTTSRSDHQPDPIITDVGKHGSTEQQAQQHQPQQGNNRRRFSNTMGGQTSAPSFSPLAIPQSANQAPYHTLSPISPVAMSAFPHHNHHHHQNSQFYSPELLSLSLSQQTTAGILPQLDRQLVFGAYGGLDPGMTNQMLDGGGIWDGMGGQRHGDGGRRSHGSAAEVLHAAVVGHTLTHHNHPGHHAHEGASSAWFMPFNMEPPEIGHDLTSLDGLGAMFGGAMTTQGGMGGGGGGGGNPNHNGH